MTVPSGFSTPSGSSVARSGTISSTSFSFCSHLARPENRCRIIVAPSTALFSAGSRDAGSDARQTLRLPEDASLSVVPSDLSPDLSVLSSALASVLVSVWPSAAGCVVPPAPPQAARLTTMLPARRIESNFFFIDII